MCSCRLLGDFLNLYEVKDLLDHSTHGRSVLQLSGLTNLAKAKALDRCYLATVAADGTFLDYNSGGRKGLQIGGVSSALFIRHY